MSACRRKQWLETENHCRVRGRVGRGIGPGREEMSAAHDPVH